MHIQWNEEGTQPKKPGVYQVKYIIDDSYSCQYWNGTEWELICDYPEMCFKEHHHYSSLFQKPIWRELRLSILQLFNIQSILMEQITKGIKNNNINWDLINILVDKLVIINRSILLEEINNNHSLHNQYADTTS